MKYFNLIAFLASACLLLASSQTIADTFDEDVAKAKVRYSIVLDMQLLMRTTMNCMAITALESEYAKMHGLAEAYYKQCMDRFGDTINVLPSEFKVRAIKHYHRVVDEIITGTAEV